MTLTIFLIAITIRAFCPEYRTLIIPESERINPFENIFKAVCRVESNGDSKAYHMEKDGHPAIGIAQIREIRVREYNRLTGADYKLSDMYSPEISRKVFMFYAQSYGVYRMDEFIRSWNGKGKATIKYLAKVKKQLKLI